MREVHDNGGLIRPIIRVTARVECVKCLRVKITDNLTKGFATCVVSNTSIEKVSRYFWYRDTKKYRSIHDTSIVKFWYRDTSKYRKYRPALVPTRPSTNTLSLTNGYLLNCQLQGG